jgi:hypothetical protein
VAYENKKFIVNLLISSSLLFAGLGSAHGAKEAIDIVFDEVSVRVTRNQISTSTPSHVKVKGNEDEIHIDIKSTSLTIGRSKPFIESIRSLRAVPGVKATLKRFAPNERCTNKIRIFNQIFLSSSSPSEQIEIQRKLCFSLLKYQKQDSTLAKKKLPLEQYKLGVILANSADESEDEVSSLQEALEVLTQSAIAGFQPAKKNLPIVQNSLGVALAKSARGSTAEISLLKEAIKLLTHSKNAGCQLAKENLPIEQCNLGIILAISARNSPDKIPLLRESIYFLTESVNAGDTCAKKYLPMVQYKLGCVLVNSAETSAEGLFFLRKAMKRLTQSLFESDQHAEKKLFAVEYKLGCALANCPQGSSDEIPLLRDAVYLLEYSLNSPFQNPKNLPFIHATLEKINHRLKTLSKLSHPQHQNGPF